MRRCVSLFVVAMTLILTWSPTAESQRKKQAKTPVWSDQKDSFGDPLPIGAIARIGTTRYRFPPGAGDASDLSPDGKLFAVLRSDEIEIWELPAWKRQRAITARSVNRKFPTDFQGLRFTADSKTLVTFDLNDQQILLIDIATGKSVKKASLGRKDPFNNVILTPIGAGQTIVCLFDELTPKGEIQQTVQVWDMDKGKLKQSWTLPPNRTGIQAYVVSADGRWLARRVAGDEDPGRRGDLVEPYIELWDLTAGKSVRKIEAMLQQMAISPDGKWLAVSDGQSVLRFHDVGTGREKHNIRLRRAAMVYFAFAPDSQALYIADATGKMDKWDPLTGELLTSYKAPPLTSAYVQKLAFQEPGKILALANRANAIHLWDVMTGKIFSPTGLPEGIASELKFTPRGELFVGADDGMLAFWNPRTGAKLRDLKLGTAGLDFNALDMEPSEFFGRRRTRGSRTGEGGDAILSSNAEILATIDGAFHDVKTGKVLYEDGQIASFRQVAFVDDGRKVAAVQNKKIRIWNARTGRDTAQFDLPLNKKEQALQLTVTPDGKSFAIVTALDGVDGTQGRTLLWDAVSKKVVREFPIMNIAPLALSPDGQWLAMAEQNRVRLARVAAKGEVDLVVPGGQGIESLQLAFSPDSRQLAVSALIPTRGDRETSRIYIYECASKKIRLELVGHPDAGIERLAFSPDSELLASGAANTTVLVWPVGVRGFVKASDSAASADELADWYGRTADADPKAAFQKMILLAGHAKQTVKLFADKIPPATKPDPGDKSVREWIQDLGSGQFGVRAKASAALQKIGRSTEPDLRTALSAAKDVETKRRIEELLDRFMDHAWTAEEILHARAVEVIEAIGTPDARTLLTRWTTSDPTSVLAIQAQRALARMR